MDATGGVACLLERDIRRDAILANMADENVGRHDRMCHGGRHLASVVLQFYRHIDRILRIGDEEYVLKGSCRRLGLRIREPLLKERGEGVAIDDRARAMVADGNLAIALHGEFGQVLAFAIPTRDAVELVECDPLLLGVARKDVVDAKCGIRKIAVKLLCEDRRAAKQKENE